MTTAGMVTAAISFAGLVFLGVQVLLARMALKETARAQRDETARLRKQAAIEMMVSTSEYRERLKADLPWNDRDPEVVATFVEEAKRDYLRLAPLREYLNHLEDLAVGTIHGVYDTEIVAILEGRRIIDAAISYRPYIEWIRETLDRPTIYSDIFDLAEIMKAVVAKLGQPWRPMDKSS
jgi:hypothetical protein